MKKIILSLSAIVIISLLALAIPVSGMGQMGMDDEVSAGQGPFMSEENQKGPLQRGYNYRYGMNGPEASVETENGNGGIGLSLKSIGFEKDGEPNHIPLNEVEWEVSEKETETGTRVTYNCEHVWEGEGGESGSVSRIKMLFIYRWTGDHKGLDVQVEITDPPADGELTVEMDVETEGLEQGCCWRKEGENQNGHRFAVVDDEENELGEIVIEDEADILVDGMIQTSQTTVNSTITETTQTLSISSSLSEDVNSYSIGGSLIIFDGMLDALGDSADKAVSYVMDHIISFAIGTGFLVVVTVASLIYLSRKDSPTGGSDLVLDNNRYYRKD